MTLTGIDASNLASIYQSSFERLGYSFFTNGDYNLNIIGVRNDLGCAENFDDKICLFYKIAGSWVMDTYQVTTEPGVSILKMPIKEVRHKGTAILVPDQYKSAYVIGWHGSKERGHTALVQRGDKVRVWRDNNRDSKPDYHGPEEDGWFGINIHKHRGSDARVNTGGVSAGCQVFRSSKDFSKFMKTCEKSSKAWGNKFTYTLVTESQINKIVDTCS